MEQLGQVDVDHTQRKVSLNFKRKRKKVWLCVIPPFNFNCV